MLKIIQLLFTGETEFHRICLQSDFGQYGTLRYHYGFCNCRVSRELTWLFVGVMQEQKWLIGIIVMVPVYNLTSVSQPQLY